MCVGSGVKCLASCSTEVCLNTVEWASRVFWANKECALDEYFQKPTMQSVTRDLSLKQKC